MMNQILLVGRVANIEERETSNERTLAVVTLAISRNYKNEEGFYDTDYVDVTLRNNIAQNTMEYCRKGDVIGIKGRVEKLDGEKELKVIVEKVTFLTSRKAEE